MASSASSYVSYVVDIFRDIKFSLLMLYFATFVMRFSAYLVIGLLTYTVDGVIRGFVISFYSILEIITVSWFGLYSDTRGRKPVLIASHAITTLGVLLMAVVGYVQGQVLTSDLVYITFVYLPIMGVLGTGAAAKVASTMTMIADESNIENRAQYMGFFDLATLGGYGAGLAGGTLLVSALGFTLDEAFLVAIIFVIISVLMVIFWVDETLTSEEKENNSKVTDHSLTRVLDVVKGNKDLQKLLPVYIPMISLYGILVTFAGDLVKNELSNKGSGGGIPHDVIIVIAIIGFFTGFSMLIMGKVSDRTRIRRPFIIVGMFSLAILIALFKYYSVVGDGKAFEGLYSILPVTILLSWGVGMFPPAILAYLTDISKKDTRGTMFGVYSVIFGSGMIIGPIVGSTFAGIGKAIDPVYGEITGIIACIFLMVILSSIGTYFLAERASDSETQVSI